MNENNHEEREISDTQPTRPAQQSVERRDLDATMPTLPVAPPESPTLAETQVTRPGDTPPTLPSAPVIARIQGMTPGDLPPTSPPKKKSRWLLITVLGLAALILIAGVAGYAGYASGIDRRLQTEKTQVAVAVEQQYELALQNIEEGTYDLARQRLEYIVRLAPSYPGAVDKLAEVMLELNTTATPTIVPTPTLTPTPDTRAVDDLFSQAQQAVLNGQWEDAINTLSSLRKADPNYRPVDVDGMFFIAFRNLGRDRILIDANLEEGIYQLTLATRFGLLDAEAQSLLNWSSLYIKGASFWGLDWGQAVFYFGQVAPYAPNLRDGSGFTATQRYQQSLYEYVKVLMEQKKWCEAKSQLEILLTMMQTQELQEAYVQASERCAAGQ